MSTAAEVEVERSHQPIRGRAAYVAAAAAGLAAVAHLLAAPEHLGWWWPAGAFLLALAAGQCVVAVLCLRGPTSGQLVAAITLMLGALVVHAWSRTADLAFAPPFPGQPADPPHGAGHGTGHGGGTAHEGVLNGHAVGGVGNGVPIPTAAPTGLEAVGLLDGLAVLAETGFVIAAAAVLGAAARRRLVDVLLVVGLAWVALRLVGLPGPG